MDAELLDILLIIKGHTGWFKGMFSCLQNFFLKNRDFVLIVFYLRNEKE